MSGSGEYTTTPNLGLYKPTYNADAENWGFHINSNSDTLDAALVGGPFLPLAGGVVTGSGVSGVCVNSVAPSESLFINLSGTEAIADNWLWSNVVLTGVATTPGGYSDGVYGTNKLMISDAAIFTGSVASGLFVQYIESGNSDAANTAMRTATQSRMIVHGQVGSAPVLGSGFTNIDFVGTQSYVYATGTQGGVGGWPGPSAAPGAGYYRGTLFGGHDSVWVAAGATNYWLLIGREIDTTIYDGMHVYQRVGLSLGSGGSRQADGDDCSILFVNGDGPPASLFAAKNAIQFGATTTQHYVTDSLIKVVARVWPGGSPAPAYVRGIDFTAATFSGNALATPGFAVNGSGHVASTGLTFGSTPAPGGVTDLSRHLDLYGGGFGFNVTPGAMNYVIGGGSQHVFYVAGSPAVYIDGNGITGQLGAAGIVYPATVTNLRVNGNAGFNNTAPIAKPTGVPVTIAAVHAALVSYGLIAP